MGRVKPCREGAFHVRTTLWQMVLFQVCAIPFLTSNIIRMIS